MFTLEMSAVWCKHPSAWSGRARSMCTGVVHAQIYLLLSCCPCEGRVSGIVDVPNACCTLAIPTAIFDQARPGLACDLSSPKCTTIGKAM